MPGDFGEIVVKYDTNRLGLINKTITVKSNSKNIPDYIRLVYQLSYSSTPIFKLNFSYAGDI